jgi:hypothetical protein
MVDFFLLLTLSGRRFSSQLPAAFLSSLPSSPSGGAPPQATQNCSRTTLCSETAAESHANSSYTDHVYSCSNSHVLVLGSETDIFIA